MNKLLPPLFALVVLTVLCWVFPPFHIRSLKSVREAQMDANFDAGEFAARFWTGKLLPAVAESAPIDKVLAAIGTDPGSVRSRFGRTVGVSSSYFLFVHGTGRVAGVDDDRVELSVTEETGEADVVIPLGFVFGNAVRDSTGLLDPSDYPNAQEFNDISAALNAMVETNVLTRVQAIASLGERIEFAGCVEVADEDVDLKPLSLVPVCVEVN